MNLIKATLFFVSVFLVLNTISCINANSANSLPKVKNAYYSTYNIKGEKGFDVEFETKNNEYLPESIIINNVKQSLETAEKTGNHYKIKVIKESRMIENFKIVSDNRENGIIFKTDKNLYFQPIQFKIR